MSFVKGLKKVVKLAKIATGKNGIITKILKNNKTYKIATGKNGVITKAFKASDTIVPIIGPAIAVIKNKKSIKLKQKKPCKIDKLKPSNSKHKELKKKIMKKNIKKKTELRFFKESVKEFTRQYMFGKQNVVVIQHRGGAGSDKGPTKFLRVSPGNVQNVDPDGDKGDFAQWSATPSNGGKQCRFQSSKGCKYLRIVDGGKGINAGGGVGPFTLFNVLKQGDGSVKLQSNKFPNAYIAVGPGNKVRPGPGGAFTKLMIYRKN